MDPAASSMTRRAMLKGRNPGHAPEDALRANGAANDKYDLDEERKRDEAE